MVWKAWILQLTLGWIFLHFSTRERGLIVSFFALNLSDLGFVLCGILWLRILQVQNTYSRLVALLSECCSVCDGI